MFEFAGLLYEIAKDIRKSRQWKGEDKLVDFEWPTYSGFAQKLASEKKTVVWVRPDQVARCMHGGLELIYEVDEKKRVRRRLVLRDGLTLMCKSEP